MRRLRVLAVVAAMCCVAPVASADTINIVVGGGWHTFCWRPDGTWAYCDVEGCPITETGLQDQWVFNSPVPTILRVTDCCIEGDIFDVYDNDSLLGRTSLGANPLLDSHYLSEDYARDTLHHLTVMLPAGSHSIEIQNVQGCCGYGLGGLRVDPIPEPATLMLLGSGILGVRLIRRRRS